MENKSSYNSLTSGSLSINSIICCPPRRSISYSKKEEKEEIFVGKGINQ